MQNFSTQSSQQSGQRVIGVTYSSLPYRLRRSTEGFAPLKPPYARFGVQGSGFGIPGGDAVSRTLRVRELPGSNKQVFRCWDEGKEGSMEQSVHRPLIKSGVRRLTVASIPQSANEDCVDPLRGISPPRSR